MKRSDWLSALALWAATVVIFGAGASGLGFYYDDGGAMATLPSSSLWPAMKGYVPGRNLHVLWQYLLYRSVGGEPAAHLPAIHLIQSALDGLVVAAFYLLLRRLPVPAPAALIAGALFSFWPTHGETHFWSYALPQNILSTLFVLLFGASTLWNRHSCLFWWLLDFGAFVGALFTYDQVFFVLAGIAVLRVIRHRSFGFAVAHLPYAVAGLLFLSMKIRIQPGQAPVVLSNATHMILVNIPDTLSQNLGRLWLRHVLPLYEKAAFADWVVAVGVAAVISALCWRLLRRPLPPARIAPLLSLAVFFYVAAYFPVWMWHASQRHHYLPSIGLFAGGAVCLAWVFERLSARAARLGLVFVLGALACVLAAACRGESRFWQESFTLKKQLFAEIEPRLQNNEVLVLADFPILLGPAYFITPHDALYGPRLFYGRDVDLARDISASPAPQGLFIRTLTTIHGPTEFEYHPSGRFLLVSFAGLENGRLRYETNPVRRPPYQILSVRKTPKGGPFAVHRVAARREAGGMIVRLEFQSPPLACAYLTTVISFTNESIRYHRWDYFSPKRQPNVLPVLLGPSGSYEWDQTLRLESFPKAERLRFEFYGSCPHHSPVPLGRAETAVEP